MKARPFLLAICCFSLVVRAETPPPPPHHSLSLDAVVVSSGGASKAETGKLSATTLSNEVSSKRDKKSGVGLDVEVRNLAPTADSAKVEWYFLGKSIGRGDAYIYETGSQEVEVAGGGAQKIPLQSKPLAIHEEKHLHTALTVEGGSVTTASAEKKGDKAAGWIVRLLADGVVLQVRASSPELENVAKNEAKFAAMPRKEEK